MVSKSDFFQLKKVGTFLHFALLNGNLAKTNKQVQSMVGNLKQLFTYDDKDLLLMSKVLGMNDFMNLELLEPNDLMNSQMDLSGIKECLGDLLTKVDQEQKFKKIKTINYFLSPSPCLNQSTHPTCKVYCKWHAKVFADWKKVNSLALLRY